MLRLGVIGCGKVTTMFHLKAIEDVEGVSVVAVADPDESRMLEVKARAGAERGYLDHLELLSDPDVDAVAVNAPPRFHEAMVVEALRAGKHVLCEKPLARSVEGCLHVKEVQGYTGLTVMPVHNYAFTPCLESARAVVEGGEIGEVRVMELHFNNNLRSYGSKTDFRLVEDLGIVEDLLPHVLSVIHIMTGGGLTLGSARGWKRSFGVVDNLSLGLENGGIPVECSMNWTSLIPAFKVKVEGDGGSLSMDLMKFPHRVSVRGSNGGRVIDKKGLGKYLDLLRIRHPAFREQYAHFVDVVERRRGASFTLDDEVEMLSLMVGVREALSETDITEDSR